MSEGGHLKGGKIAAIGLAPTGKTTPHTSSSCVIVLMLRKFEVFDDDSGRGSLAHHLTDCDIVIVWTVWQIIQAWRTNMRTIRISDEVWKYMEEHGRFGETADDVLRRGLGLSSAPHRRTNEDTEGHATVPLHCRVEDGSFKLSFDSGDNMAWPLPARDDKDALHHALDVALGWAKERQASLGQLNAVRKAFTDHGYHLIKSPEPHPSHSSRSKVSQPIVTRSHGGGRHRAPRGNDGLADYVLPIVKDILGGMSHVDAFRRCSDRLKVSTSTARDRCTRGQGLDVDGLIELVGSGRIAQRLKVRYPDRHDEIESALGA